MKSNIYLNAFNKGREYERKIILSTLDNFITKKRIFFLDEFRKRIQRR